MVKDANVEADPERRWLAEVYAGGARQLTPRAVIAGMLLGAVMCLSNLYVVLKTGWSFGVTITACILAYAIFRGFKALGLAKTDLSTLENNAMGSVASAAGYMTGGGNMAAIPALLMLTGFRPDGVSMFAWFACIAALGVFAAIPIKRQLVNIEQLPFPTGTATAETLRSLHGHGAEAAGKALRLGVGALVGVAVAVVQNGFKKSLSFGLPFNIAGRPAADWTLKFDGSLLLVGAGALMSFKTGWSLLLGAGLTYGVLAPSMVERGVITGVAYKSIVQWTLWGGAAVLLSSGLLSFAFQWRSVARSFNELGRLIRKSRKAPAAADGGAAADEDPMTKIECPASWFPMGFALLSPVVVFLMGELFGIPVWAACVAIPLAIVMGVVAARVTGETDTTPTKALGPVTQLVYGALLPGNIPANVMGANVTGGVGLHAADLLTDLKSGFLLGANPRQQFYGQLFGVIAGALMVVPAFNLLVPSADVLGSDTLPAPSALVWAGVSKILAGGVHVLHPTARLAAAVGAALGIALVLSERWAPSRAKPFVPSASGLGLAMVLPGANSIAMFAGAAAAAWLRRWPALAERNILPVSSGLIAGESLMSMLLLLLAAIGILR